MEEKMKIDKLVPDTSVIIEGLISKRLKEKKIQPNVIIIHEAVLAELENQANKNRAIGKLGLEEIKEIKGLETTFNFKINFTGRRPNASEIKYASLGEIDALIRSLAFEEGATLFTADKVQSEIAKIKGVDVIFAEIGSKEQGLPIEKYFDKTTMSIHLRENIEPYAKKGVPGKWEFVKLRKKLLTREELEKTNEMLIEAANMRKDGFIEIERHGSTIMQIERYRIVITRPPLSDGWEITAVRPVRIMTLSEYNLSDKLTNRISKQAEGILIAGSPGMGKSTFAQALATFYADGGKIVKTIEAPRDLLLKENITQYAISRGTPQEIHDVLLLSRPDYTIFDEMRNTNDFKLFSDLRLAGIGLAGVVHATNPIDAIQRFVGRIELGVIPHVIDTVIFIKNGQVFKLLSLEMVVKVPSGMTEADLARPVVVVKDFETGKLEYELYSYGEETVVIPVKADNTSNPAMKMAAKGIKETLEKRYGKLNIEMVSNNKCILYAQPGKVSQIIGRNGKNIDKLEKELGLSIDVREMDSKNPSNLRDNRTLLDYKLNNTKKKLIFVCGAKYSHKNVDLFIDGELILNAKIGKDGKLKISRNSEIGAFILDALDDNKEIYIAEE